MKRIENVYPSWGVLNDGSQEFEVVNKYMRIHFNPYIKKTKIGEYLGVTKEAKMLTYWRSENPWTYDKILTLAEFISLTKEYANDIENPFLSPIESERNKQEEDLKLLFPEYPEVQNWQLLNSLIHIAKVSRETSFSDNSPIK